MQAHITVTAEQIGLGITWSQNLKDMFSHVQAHITVTAELIGLGITWSKPKEQVFSCGGSYHSDS